MNMQSKYSIGTKFTTRGKSGNEHEVVDIYTTYNSHGDVVRQRYVTVHKLMNQNVVEEVTETTIDMSLGIAKQSAK